MPTHKKRKFDINGTNSLRVGRLRVLFPFMHVEVGEPPHLVPGHGARVRYSLGTNVNTLIFSSIPTLEFGQGAGAPVQGRDLVLGRKSGHQVPVCTPFLLVLWQ